MCTIGRTSVGTARKAHHRPDRTECTTRCEQDRTDYGSKRGRNSFLNTALAPIAQKSIVVDSYGSNGINVITQELVVFPRDHVYPSIFAAIVTIHGKTLLGQRYQGRAQKRITAPLGAAIRSSLFTPYRTFLRVWLMMSLASCSA